jgi:hypothetical protein
VTIAILESDRADGPREDECNGDVMITRTVGGSTSALPRKEQSSDRL